jgi:hypothetical protein
MCGVWYMYMYVCTYVLHVCRLATCRAMNMNVQDPQQYTMP